MAQKLFGINKPDTRLRKNVFDLSASNTFSMSAGMLVPTMVRDLNPGEKVEMSVASLVRTQPLNTAAFVKIQQFYHVFFVPYKQLWEQWDNFINGVDYRTSSLQKKPGESIPAFRLSYLIETMFREGIFAGKDAINGAFSKKVAVDPLGYSYVFGVSRLLDMLGYGFEITLNPKDYVTGWKLDGSNGDIFNPDYSHGGRSGGHGSRSYDKPVGSTPRPSTPPPPPGSSDASSKKLLRIASLSDFCAFVFANSSTFLGVSNTAYASSAPSIQPALTKLITDCFGSYNFNPFRLLAYQKIYYDYYRRQDYEANMPEHYNIDDSAGGSTIGALTAKRLLGICQLRYRWTPKDYFTGVVPSELYGTENLSSASNLSALLPDGRQAMLAGAQDGTGFTLMDASDGRQVKLGDQVSTRSIRAMFAVEKLLRLTRRAGNFDYISQVAAHYGVDVPSGRGDEVKYLGGWSNNIDISEVITTAQTEKGDPAQIFGRGVGTVSGKDINFEAKEHGMLVVMSSIVPDSDYSGVGMNAFNTKLFRGDFFHPEFQDLGLQPLMSHELAFNPYKLARSGSDHNRSVMLGYSPRYAEYKTAYDELHGEFRYGKEFSPWVSSRKTLDQSFFDSSGIRPSALLVSPSQLDSIFSVRFDGTESTDQFICVAHHTCKIIRPMSVTGQNL